MFQAVSPLIIRSKTLRAASGIVVDEMELDSSRQQYLFDST
jgi:hypothetical protein